MKLIILLFLSYYAHCQGLQDSLLVNALHDTISTGERYHYGTHGYSWPEGEYYMGTWNFFPLTDCQDNGTIWDMYSNSVRYYPYAVGESACSIQIEHCLPKGWWGATDTTELTKKAWRDLFNLNPSDARANNNKSDYPPGHVSKGDKFDNGSFRMDAKKSSQYGYICFEPAPEYRGDFARTYFYMATAYQDLPWASKYSDYLSFNSYLIFSNTLIQVLLDWHRADPVSEKEVHRASVITSLQHNHNPFIDYPELVEYIWGNRKGQAVDFNTLTCTYDSTYVPQPITHDTTHRYDTLVSLPAVTKNLVNQVPGGYASEKIQSNGTCAITMGASSTDGWISFSNLHTTDSAWLVFRASVYNTASSMELKIYANGRLLRTIEETVVQETRNESYYTTVLPIGTDSVKILSVGGGTSKRACMQELYVVKKKSTATGLSPSLQEEVRHYRTESASTPLPSSGRTTQKVLTNGHIQLSDGNTSYTLLGQKISNL